jgi:hypothetical protein
MDQLRKAFEDWWVFPSSCCRFLRIGKKKYKRIALWRSIFFDIF